MSITLALTDALAIGALILILGGLIGYACGLADFERLARRIRSEGPR